MIIWNENIAQAIRSHALKAYPFECCGFLLGTEQSDGSYVEELVAVENTHKGEQRRRFFIDPISYMRAEREAERKGLTLLGVYHSHPNHPAIPSEEDRKHAVSGFHYPIVSVNGIQADLIRSWTLVQDRQFEEEGISTLLTQ